MRLGFVGTGTLSAAVVQGLQEVHGDQLEMNLSPRSESFSTQLASQFASVRRCSSNQEVVDQSDIIVVAIRPQQVVAALSELTFRKNQTIVSFVAGLSNKDIAQHTGPAQRVIRITPLPMIALQRGPILIYPYAPDLAALFDRLGTIIVPESQDQMMALGYAGGLMATFFEMANTAIDWLDDHSLSRETSRDYLMSMYEALGRVGASTSADELHVLPEEYSTPGGLNERCHAYLREIGWFRNYASGLDAMQKHFEDLQSRN